MEKLRVLAAKLAKEGPGSVPRHVFTDHTCVKRQFRNHVHGQIRVRSLARSTDHSLLGKGP
jgi:hypothetical protein